MKVIYSFEEGIYVMESPEKVEVAFGRFLALLHNSYEENEFITILDEKSGKYIQKGIRDVKSINIIFDNEPPSF